jgi:hypothetical protein
LAAVRSQRHPPRVRATQISAAALAANILTVLPHRAGQLFKRVVFHTDEVRHGLSTSVSRRGPVRAVLDFK